MSQKISDLVEAWFGGEYMAIEDCADKPEVVWQAILIILQRPLSDDQKALLAAGLLETLLAIHGHAFITRVEDEAARNPRFNDLLGGVWRHEMPMDIWQRIESARKKVW